VKSIAFSRWLFSHRESIVALVMRVALLAFGVAFAACTNATGEVVGGQPLPVIASIAECSATGAACSSWTYLYNCYFGPTGAAGCSAQSQCHASTAGLGYLSSGFLCGPTAATCWQGMTGATVPLGNPILVRVSDSGATDPYLLSTLHKSTGSTAPAGVVEASNNMPLMSVDTQAPAATFMAPDLACIAGWIKAGAPED
jgi:hypothetical protein